MAASPCRLSSHEFKRFSKGAGCLAQTPVAAKPCSPSGVVQRAQLSFRSSLKQFHMMHKVPWGQRSKSKLAAQLGKGEPPDTFPAEEPIESHDIELLNRESLMRLLDGLDRAGPRPTVEDSQVLVDSFVRLQKDQLLLRGGQREEYLLVSGKSPLAVVVLATSHDRKRLVVNAEYRHAVGKYVLSLPGGAVDSGETPVQAAARELEEETGLTGREFLELGRCYALPGLWAQEVVFVHAEVQFVMRQQATNRRGVEAMMLTRALEVSDVSAVCDNAVDGLLLAGLAMLRHHPGLKNCSKL